MLGSDNGPRGRPILNVLFVRDDAVIVQENRVPFIGHHWWQSSNPLRRRRTVDPSDLDVSSVNVG